MSNVWAIFRREIYSLFTSWIAYVVLGLFLVIFGYFFYSILYSFIEYGFRVNEYGGSGTLNINQDMIRWLFDNTAVIVLFMIPGLLFIILLVVALVLLLQRGAPAVQTPASPMPAMIPREIPQPALPQLTPPVNPVQERELVGSLPEDQRLLYVRIREAGGAVLQSDIVRWGLFSKPKVTRLLDRLEARGLAVRERHGMTNRVRLLPPTKPVS